MTDLNLVIYDSALFQNSAGKSARGKEYIHSNFVTEESFLNEFQTERIEEATSIRNTNNG
jgi:hypothetical protein